MTTPVWTTACPNWETAIEWGGSIIPPPIFPDEAEGAMTVMRELKIVDAPGSPTMGSACAPWVFDFAGSLFGSYNAETGRRLIVEYLLCIPKKNSKSTIAAAIMLTALIRNWRMSAEFIILAPTKEIADNSFAPARDMIKADDDLSALLHVQDHIRTITHRETGATLKVVAADTNTVGGKKAVGVLIDEAWIFGKQANAEDMIREATGGLASRPEGFVIWLTTQSNEPPAGVFKQKMDYARRVRDGEVVDPKFLPVIYEFPKEFIKQKLHLDPSNFHLVNPNYDYSVDREFLEREFTKALDAGEESLRGFLAKHLNVEIGLALRADRWSGAEFWEQQARKVTLDTLIAECEVIDVGIDGGGLDDLLGYSAIGRHAISREWLVWTAAIAHPSVLVRRKDIVTQLREFEKDGDLTIVQKHGQDVELVAEWTSKIHEAGLLDKVGADPAGVGSILDALSECGIPEDKIVGVSQGWRMSGSIKTTERKLADGSLIHGGQRLMNWCVGNARVVPTGNAILITKQASGTAKIDPLMATFNAVSLMSLNPAPTKMEPTIRWL
ncbi:MAG: terminase large subunit [Fluviibacter phosphoraccumulans]